MIIRKHFLIPLFLLCFAFASTQSYASEKALFSLTPEEKAWLDAHPVIRLGFGKDWEPAIIIDEDGKLSGFIVDFFDQLNRELGTNIIIETGAWPDIVQQAKNQEIDGIAACAPVLAKANRWLSTRSHFINYVTVFVQEDDPNEIKSFKDLEGRTVSVVKGFKIAEILLKPFREKIKVIETRSTFEGIKLVLEGKAGAAVGLIMDNYLIARHILTGIKAGFIDIDNPLLAVTAIRNDWPELVGILNKGIDSIGQAEINEIFSKWTKLPTPTQTIQLTAKERTWLKAHPLIRVHNEKDWPPFNYFEYGKPQGLSIDYMNLVAEQLGIKIEYVSGPSWDEFLGMVKRKELDVMLNIVKTEDRLKYLLFTEPYFKNPNVIVSSQENPYETIEALFGKTVAFPKGFYYEEVLTKSFPRIKRLPVEDTLAGLNAVAFGRADAALSEAVVVRTLINKNFISGLQISGEVKIGDPDLTNMRIGVRDDWPLLHSALMKAMAAIAPQEMNQIRQKWIARVTEEKDRIPLTDAERKWLADHRDIRLGVDPAWPPFEFIDKSGNYAGIGSGFIDAISDRLNIKMKPIPGLTWSQVIEKAKAGEIDVLPAVMRTSERDKYLNFTKPYLSFPVVIATNKKVPFIGSIKGLEGYQVGVVKDYYTEDILRSDHPYLTLVTYPTLAEALQELDAGLIDAFIDNMVTITQEIARSGLENIRVSSSTEYAFELFLGVRKELPELVGIDTI
jgi:ABC-type amino acid transport substrate-binding protein